MAFIVRKPGSNINEAQIIDFVAKQVMLSALVIFSVPKYQYKQTEQLDLMFWFAYVIVCLQVAPYKKVRRVAFINAIPKNPAGKILRRELTKIAVDGNSSKL